MKEVTCIFILIVVSFLLVCCNSKSKVQHKTARTAVWERLGPGGGGATFIPTFSYHNANNFLVRCDMTGAYLTNDGGNRYSQINYPNGSTCFAYDPLDSNTIYIGASALNRTADGGKTWKQIFPGKSEIKSEKFIGDHASYELKTEDSSVYKTGAERIASIRADPFHKDAIYFTMAGYFYYSYDDGQSWSKQNLGQPLDYLYTDNGKSKNEVYIFSSDSIFIFNKLSQSIIRKAIPKAMSPAVSFTAGAKKGSGQIVFYALHQVKLKEDEYGFGHTEIWFSDDMGGSWAPVKDPLITNENAGSKPSYIKLVCSEMDADKVYVVANQYQEKKDNKTLNWYGALKTNNGGQSWNWVWKGGGGSGVYGVQDATDAENLNDAWVHKAFGGEFIQLMDVGVSPVDGNIAIVTDWYRTMKTMDGGKTWEEIYSIQNADSTYTSSGMDVTTTYGVHFDPFHRDHIAISYTDIGFHQSFNGGKSWSRSVTGVPGDWVNTCYWVVFDPDVKNKVWSVWSGMHDIPRGKMTRDPEWKESSAAKGGVCISMDGGKTWKPSVIGMGMNSPATSIVIDPKSKPGNRTLYTTVYNKGVFKSTDDGKTWALKNKGIGNNTCAFEITLASNGNLYLTVCPVPVHKDGKKDTTFYSGEVYKSADGAETWTKLHITNELLFPNGIEVDPVNPDRIYLGCWADIQLSDLVGGSVTRAKGGSRQFNMPGGIFMSGDGGKTWESIFDQKQFVYDVTVDRYHPGRLYCNTFNKAAYRSDDYGKNWKKIKGYDFHWGHRIIVDEKDHEKVYITTFGSSVWHGVPEAE